MLRSFALLAVALIFGSTLAARADEAAPNGGIISELKIGVLAHDVPDLWSGFQVESPAADLNAEIDFHPLWASEASSVRPAIGGTLNRHGQTSHAYADLRWQINPSPIWYLTFGIGAAYNNGVIYDPTQPDRKWLGSHILFHPSVEFGLNLDPHSSLSVYFEHMSNGNLATYNEGMDDIGVRYGFKF